MIGRRWVLGLVAASLATASACSASPPVPDPSVPAPSSVTATSSPSEQSCAGEVRLVASTGQSEVITRESSPRFDLRVGDTLRVGASGRCGARVVLSPGARARPR